MSDGAMCHYCRKYKCECIEEDLRDRVADLSKRLAATDEAIETLNVSLLEKDERNRELEKRLAEEQEQVKRLISEGWQFFDEREALRKRLVEVEAELKAEREQRERGCWHCKHFVGYHHAGKIDGQCTAQDCRCVNYQTATEVIQEERERLDEARRGLVRAGERRERAEAALRAIRGGKNSCIAWLQSKEHVSAYFSPNAIADIDSVYMAVVAEEALKSVSSDPKE